MPSLPYLPVFACLSVLFMSGCAGALPGGKETVNAGFYNSGEELKDRIAQLEPGMTRDAVFAKLGRTQDDFTRLNREQIVIALFGGKEAILPGTRQEQILFLRALTGYRLDFRTVKRRHGFTSPITVKTDKKGFEYSLTLIFYDDTLLEAPVAQGGVITGADSKTLFDYLNPGLIFGGFR